MTPHRRFSSLIPPIFAILALLVHPAAAYRTGDPVHALLYTPTSTTDVKRSQVPLFGVSRTVSFPRYRQRFSLGFEQGMWTIPWISSSFQRDSNEQLAKVTIEFVYSSNSGTIHSISKKSTYASNKELASVGDLNNLPVEYVWVKEEPVDIQAGNILMFLATLVMSVIFFINACSVSDEEYTRSDRDNSSCGPTAAPSKRRYGGYGGASSSASTFDKGM